MKLLRHFSLIPVFLMLISCGGGSEDTSSNVTGTVTAPGGEIAFNPPTTLHKLASSFFGSQAVAAISGVNSVGAGVTIQLVEVDAAGVTVGDVIETATTNSNGQYTFLTTITPNGKYVIRAKGISEDMDVRYTSRDSSIDPITTAVSSLITDTASDLSKLSVEEIIELQGTVAGIAQEIDVSSLTTVTALRDKIKAEANDNEEFSNQLSSTVAAGSICGNVKDASNANLDNIRIIVRDFGDGVTRAKSKTNSDGNYCVSVPPNKDYIVGALNFTSTSFAASEWWHSGGTAYTYFEAEKVAVLTATKVADFKLEAGARLTGSVKAAAGGALVAGTALEGVKIVVRKFVNFIPIAGKRVNAAGTYRVNVIPGDYLISARNRTLKPYASIYYDGTVIGADSFFTAGKVTLTAGTSTPIDFNLVKGFKLSGTVDDGTNPVTGVRVKINGSGVQRLRTNKKGKYRVWVRPLNNYNVQSYGSNRVNTVDLSTANQVVNFTGAVNTITGTVKYNGTGVAQAKVFLTDSTNGNALISQELSSSDGSVTLHCKIGVNCSTSSKIYVRIDEAQAWGTTHYDMKKSRSLASVVDATQSAVASDIDLFAGGELSLFITTDGTTPHKGYGATIKDTGTGAYLSGTKTHGDGVAVLSVPVPTSTYEIAVGSFTCTGVPITAGAKTTVNYSTANNVNTAYDIADNTCK